MSTLKQSEQKMSPIRVGMVGVNNFGKYRRYRMRETGLFQIVACFDFDKDALAVAQQEEQCDIVEQYDDLLSRNDIEGIVVSTGANSHADYCIRAANAGKHFFVEKPLCTNKEEMIALLEAGRNAGVVMGMGHNSCDSPIDDLVRQYIAEDKLGTVTAIEMTTAHGGGWVASPWRFIKEKNPGGMLFQCGVHSLHWLQTHFGPVTEVASMMRYDVNPETSTSDATTVLLRLESGLLATLHAYHVTAYQHYTFLYGTKGNLYIYEFPTNVFYQARANGGAVEERVKIELSEDRGMAKTPSNDLSSWAHAIREGGKPFPSIEDGARAVAVVFAAEESASNNRFVTVAPFSAEIASTK